MANNLATNPIILDTAGATSAVSNPITVTSIIVNASADTWSCVIHDKPSGNIIFQADSSVANHRSIYWSPAEPITFSGLYWTTDTNIANVLIYLK